MNPFDQTGNNSGTIIDQAFRNGNAAQPAQGMMTTMPMPMPMPMNNQNQTVPNVMMDMPEEQFQQQNAQYNVGYMQPQQVGYADGKQQPLETFDLNVPHFDIEDPLLRRQFCAKVFAILLLQHLCAIPIMEIFILCASEPIRMHVFVSFWFLGFLLFIAMYCFSDYRRYSPVNYMTLAFTTVYVGVQAGIYGTNVGHVIGITSQLIIVLQLAFVIAFTKQTRFKFNNLNGIVFTLLIFLIIYTSVTIVEPHFPHIVEFWIAFIVMYFIYDMHLMQTGHHRYNLKPDEHIFGACNIYADLPNIKWRLLRYFIIDPIIRIAKFLYKTCFSEVC